MDEAVLTLKKLIDGSDSIVFFGGAGVSTESGIPDFRSVDGLYSQKYDVPPETIISHTYLEKYPDKFYAFYKDKMLYPQAKPNDCHKALARLEQQGKLKAVITQNVDGLHQEAGSKTVYELHGSVHRNYCTSCGKKYQLQHILNSQGLPKCSCGGFVRPDVVLYEEGLDHQVIENAVSAIRHADMLIVGGTSLTVYPAAGLINYYRGNKLVLINKSATGYDKYANLTISDSIGKVLGQCVLM
jgi:NAD-dependent deacetylase